MIDHRLEIGQKNRSDILSQSIYGAEGYTNHLMLTHDELESLRTIIRMQWLYRLQLLVPQQLHSFDRTGMEYYHEFDHLIDHAKIWPKHSRVFPKEAVALVRKMNFFKELEASFGDIQIADEENLGWENIYWRLVRPGKSDFGTLHSDRWFVELGYYGKEIQDETRERVKIWIAIYTSVGRNGLLVIPGSHCRHDWKWHSEKQNGQLKPVIDEDLSLLNVMLLPTEPGRAVIFNYDLIHGGAPNLAETTRVSIEFTFLIRKI